MKFATPESVGISTDSIKKYLAHIEKYNLPIHSVLIARGDKIVFEKYWEPFNRDFLHRQYSVSKSFVSLAIGFLEQEGKISLDDKIADYFPDEIKNQPDENMKNQTIRHMLMMSTAKLERSWFVAKTDDRVRFYFENDRTDSRPSGTIYQYDSTGSFVLGALVERVTGMSLMEYLKEKMFDKIGVEGAYCLKCPGGHSWGDSAVMMRSIDLLRSARFVLNKGSWHGEQLLNREYLEAATTKQIDNDIYGSNEFDCLGYGYKFWISRYGSFFFNGMGSQLALCMPEKDLILVVNADTQAHSIGKSILINGFFDIVYNDVKDEALPEYKGEPIAPSKLYALKNSVETPVWEKINGKVYKMNRNDMDISEFSVSFDGNKGRFDYVNKTGRKSIPFGICENIESYFPEEGYSDETGTYSCPGHKYKCTSSAAWVTKDSLKILVQIIDKYFGSLSITIGFRDNVAGIRMQKCAEYFLMEYNGYGSGITEE